MNFSKTGIAAIVFGSLFVAKTTFGGTIGTITDIVNPSHDLSVSFADPNEVYTQMSSSSSGVFDFDLKGTTPSGSFELMGTMDQNTGTVTGTMTANGDEQSPSTSSVSYNDGAILKVDDDLFSWDSPYTGPNGQLTFLLGDTATSAPNAFVWVNFDGNATDVSPVTSVPTPAAISGGAALLGLVGIGSRRRRTA